jgi:hypothetical protein
MMETVGVDRLNALYTAIELVRRGGTISLSGVYGGMADPMPMMTLFDKQIQLRMGQANVHRWAPDILPLLLEGDPLGVEGFATHRLPLEAAPDAYATFQARRDGMVKTLCSPRSPDGADGDDHGRALGDEHRAAAPRWPRGPRWSRRAWPRRRPRAPSYWCCRVRLRAVARFAPVGLPLDQQVPWLASLTEPALAALGPLPPATASRCSPDDADGGAGPGRRAAAHVNRAWLMTRKAACQPGQACLSPASRTARCPGPRREVT